MAENDVDNELLDYEDDEVENAAGADGAEAPPKKDVKGSYVSIHSSGFRDFLLKPELLRAIVDCGFEHPSEARVHPPGHPGHGRAVPGQVRDGQNRRVRSGHAAAAGARHGPGVGAGDVPHPGIGVPDQQGVRALLQVHAQRQGGRFFRGPVHQEGRGGAEEELPPHRGGDPGQDPGPGPEQEPQPQTHQTFHPGRVRQDARAARHAAGRAGDFPHDAAREAGDDVQRHPEQGDPPRVPQVHARPHGDLCGRRDEADAARAAAVLRQTQGQREEQETLRPARRARVQPGCDLCQVRAALHRPGPAAGGAKLPGHRHPQGHAPGGEAVAVPAVQGLPAPDPGGHEPVWARDGHREGQHRLQLRHARGLRHLPAQGGPGGPFRHQGLGHHLRVGRERRQNPQRRPGSLRGQHQRAARRDRHLLLHRTDPIRTPQAPPTPRPPRDPSPNSPFPPKQTDPGSAKGGGWAAPPPPQSPPPSPGVL